MHAGRVTGCALALTGALAVAGCGGNHVNHDRPAPAISVTAAIIDGKIVVSPRRFGAGPIRLVITNQMPSTQALTFETDETDASRPGITRSTTPIVPSSTATLEVNVR